MAEFNRPTFAKDDPELKSPCFARIEETMNSRQDLITRYAEKYDIETDWDNRFIGDEDLLVIDPIAFDEWAAARNDIHAIRETAETLGCRVSRGGDMAWHVSGAQTRTPAPGVSQAIDPQGRVVLEMRGADALLFDGYVFQPFFVARRYDEKTGHWDCGDRFGTVQEAAEALYLRNAKHAKRSGVRGLREMDR